MGHGFGCHTGPGLGPEMAYPLHDLDLDPYLDLQLLSL